MSRKKKMRIILNIICILCLLFCRLYVLPVHAQGQRLIQTTTQEDEIQALIRLNLLEVWTGREENLQKAELENRQAVVEIDMGTLTGSGVIFDITEEYIVILSNKHVLEAAETGTVLFEDGFGAEGSTAAVSEDFDIGIMRVASQEVPSESMRNLKKAAVSEACYEALKPGSEMFLAGSADGAGKSIFEGTIRNPWWFLDEFNTYMIYSDCYAKPGMSGCGTFDAHGHYIGMLTGGNGTESASLPLTTILEEYEKLSLEISQ